MINGQGFLKTPLTIPKNRTETTAIMTYFPFNLSPQIYILLKISCVSSQGKKKKKKKVDTLI